MDFGSSTSSGGQKLSEQEVMQQVRVLQAAILCRWLESNNLTQDPRHHPTQTTGGTTDCVGKL